MQPDLSVSSAANEMVCSGLPLAAHAARPLLNCENGFMLKYMAALLLKFYAHSVYIQAFDVADMAEKIWYMMETNSCRSILCLYGRF